MNQTSNYIFGIYHYLLNLRDTLEYAIDREHKEAMYSQRKNVLVNGLQENAPLGSFFKNNPEQGEKIKEKINEFIDEVYGENSAILRVSDDKVRVDHTQHIKIFDFVCGLQESVRDILYGYINFANKNHENETVIQELVDADDRLYRCVFFMLVLREFEKSFGEFQKVMSESKGQPTPQSNFIVQNEIVKMTSLLRFCHQHHHCKENEIMDVLDQTLAVIEMTEGRRDRRDNKSFKDLFEELNKKLNELVAKYEQPWREKYNAALKEALDYQEKMKNSNTKPN